MYVHIKIWRLWHAPPPPPPPWEICEVFRLQWGRMTVLLPSHPLHTNRPWVSNNMIHISSFLIIEFTGGVLNPITSTLELKYTGHNEPTCHVKQYNCSSNLSCSCTIDPHLCCLDSGNDTVRLNLKEIRECSDWSKIGEEIEVVCSLSTKKECINANIKLNYNFRTG